MSDEQVSGIQIFEWKINPHGHGKGRWQKTCSQSLNTLLIPPPLAKNAPKSLGLFSAPSPFPVPAKPVIGKPSPPGAPLRPTGNPPLSPPPSVQETLPLGQAAHPPNRKTPFPPGQYSD
ncbi:hypothetical protein K443DRAFT_12971 [Laccaria amethystina LaAM-08-1]|uniref:Uncharacterized protein n=1 Tax=Laccaria amethystina LaAM-08-1 TaxID=1095629 RepID=A0A0C9WWU4_9AGAR|nr:hypothetical protein K443DRAFT_12971 [Laccaria amethystina LaAM-08-1]